MEDDYIAYLRESKKEALLVLISRTGVKAEIDLSSFGYEVAKVLYGQEAKGPQIAINSKGATCGVWQLKSLSKISE